MYEYFECLLDPTIYAGSEIQDCRLYEGKGYQSPEIKALMSYPVMLLDHSRCANLSGFQEEDDRMMLFEPAAVYTRPESTDAFSMIQV